jgi:hypothetical protein
LPQRGAADGGREPEKSKTNISSLDDARKRAIAETKQKERASRPPSSTRDLIIGGVLILMALGMIWHWLAPLLRSSGVAR